MILDKVIVVEKVDIEDVLFVKAEKKEEIVNITAMNAKYVYVELGHLMANFVGLIYIQIARSKFV